jgi:hypothetical protein
MNRSGRDRVIEHFEDGWRIRYKQSTDGTRLDIARSQSGWRIRFIENAVDGTWSVDVKLPNEVEVGSSPALAVLQALRLAMITLLCVFMFAWLAVLMASS